MLYVSFAKYSTTKAVLKANSDATFSLVEYISNSYC